MKITEAISAKTVDDYLSVLPEKVRTTLRKLRKIIRSAAPKAEEVLSYQIPTYKYYGPLVHFAAQRDHCSLTVVSKSVVDLFKKELQGYKISGRTIHFSAEKPLPATLVKKIVKVRITENEARPNSKKELEKIMKELKRIK